MAVCVAGAAMVAPDANGGMVTRGFGPDTWTVPPGVSEATFDLYGAQGGGYGPELGGRGAHVHATIPVVPGEVLQTNGGGGGGVGGTGPFFGGGFNGGGVAASGSAFGGGGGTDVRRGPGYELADRLLVAGGGGGDAESGVSIIGFTVIDFPPGNGGDSGTSGIPPASVPTGESGGSGGGPGTQSAGGTARGILGVGGSALVFNGQGGAGGGGGGGYYGGGGGGQGSLHEFDVTEHQLFYGGGGGGGGGSSFVPAGAGTVVDGVNTGSGFVTITWEPTAAVTTGAADAVTKTSATVAGTIDPRGNASTYRFEYGPTVAYGLSTAETSAGDGTGEVAVSAALSGFEPGTEYHYRIVGTTCGGCPLGTTAGADGAFTTGAPPPDITATDAGEARFDKKGKFALPGVVVKCPAGGAACEVSVTVRSKRANPGPRQAPPLPAPSVTPSSGPVLASTSFTIAPGDSADVTLTLTRKGRKKAKRKLQTNAEISVVAGPEQSSATIALVLKPAPRH